MIASFITAVERELQLLPLNKLPLLLNSWGNLLSNLSMQVSWAAYDLSLASQKEELGVLDLLLAEILQCCAEEGLSSELSLKQLERERSKRLKEETKGNAESSVADTIVYLHSDLIVWLRQSITSIVNLPRGRPVNGILHVTQACVEEVIAETYSDLRKRFELPYNRTDTVILSIVVRFMSELDHGRTSDSRNLQNDIRVIYEIIEAAEGAKISFADCFHAYTDQVQCHEKKAKKPRSTSSGSSDPEVDAKCRFLMALHCIERHGVVRIGGTGRNASTIHCQMFNWLREDD